MGRISLSDAEAGAVVAVVDEGEVVVGLVEADAAEEVAGLVGAVRDLAEVEDLTAVVVVRDRVVVFPAERDRRLGVRRRSAILPRAHRFRRLGPVQESAHVQTMVAEILEAEILAVEIGHRFNPELDRTSEQEETLRGHVLPLYPALGRAAALVSVRVKGLVRELVLRVDQDLARGSAIVMESRNNRLDCRDRDKVSRIDLVSHNYLVNCRV